MIAMHAMATDDPRQLRWVVAPDDLPPAGTVRQAPGRLGALLDSGVIEQLVVRTADVLITLSTGNSWRELGDQVQDALADALLHPATWQADAVTDDLANLAEIASKLLMGSIGDLAESHGGSIELVSVTGTNVAVRMSGACKGCPAASSTLHDKLQRELRRQVGQQVTVSSETGSAPLALGKKLLSLMVR
ncbi:nitrogen fixation protein NifU [Mycobacterium haemophilum]|uniref:Nitrogen fixation protein NifU n=2 Tax=Mycobacterium haemophilum TaxID=29311 RepID=A0A0I9TZW9_9MYCO|nr:nitrogen fixation protein NifU [Mycobacterium haemophilum]KLO35286.1 nitrogen fixation protein NifU [Mycobacterium haemophilum]KLO40298.1 nitrogen fixation protein NifU [Mycobacterium haemophilum]KLO47572.1 nitrogen fixation protein NifU [Mycobacterium haemophilum]